jgi:alkanesulfonate monooxygenase SsuD/methylene tetrahydromethanopterin reductase-like flavin-dependent oxidoreductase (luciferase family)
MYFTEQPMSAYPEEEGRKLGYTALVFPNKYFDPVAGSQLYEDRIVEYKLAEESGYDGIMLNEHHNAPFCMQAKCNVMASILAAVTKRVKIVLLGNPLPIADNPVRLAEELAMIDMISKGRLVSGFVRGGGVESLATNTNPAYNRERFEEAHDLIIKTWTTPGPWRWEGRHYQFRVVNPWVLPLQKPHPRIWIPGVSSRETIIWAAQHRYPYLALNTSIEDSKKIWAIYDETAEQAGYKGGPEQRGYLIRCHVQESEEKALANARQFMWMQGEFTGLQNSVWQAPSGYLGTWARRALAEVHVGRRRNPAAGAPFEKQIERMLIVAGTPDQVVQKLRVIMEETRPSIMALWGNDGNVTHKDAKTCIRLTGQEVLPRLRKIGESLGLDSPFNLNTPVSLTETPAHQQSAAAGGA